MEDAMESMEARVRAQLGLNMDGSPVEHSSHQHNYQPDSHLSAASQLLFRQRKAAAAAGSTRGHNGNVVTVSTGAQEPIQGLLAHSWITCEKLFLQLTDELINELLTTPEGPTMLLSPEELAQYQSICQPFLGRCSELRGQYDRMLSIAEWHQQLRPCCADIEARHCEIIELGGNTVRVAIVHLGHGLFGHVLLLCCERVDWLRPGVSNMPTDTSELYTFYSSFLTVSIEKASGMLP
jgi:hypothetical protein